MDEKLVSIIIPCYKHANLLSETLDSVIAQTYKNWECIVVNDGSPDNTEEVANIYCKKDDRIKLLNQKNQGVAVARNNGIHNSKGEFILPLDGDDLIEPTYIEKAMLYYSEHPDVKLVYSKADRFDQKKESWFLPEYSYENEIWDNLVFCSAIYKRSDYDKTEGYNPNMREGYEDWDFWLSFLKPEDIVYRIDEVLFHYRYQKKSRDSASHDKRQKLYKQIYENHPEIYKNYVENIIFYKYKASRYDRIVNTKVFKIAFKLYNLLKK